MAASLTLRAEAPLSDFAISPSGSEMAGSCADGRIRVWSAEGGLLRSWAPRTPPTPYLMYLGDRRVVTGGPGGMTVLDAASGNSVSSWAVPELVHAAAASDGSLLAGAAADGTAPLWKPDGTRVRSLSAPGMIELTRVAVSPRGERVAVCGTDADLRLFEAASGRRERTIDLAMAAFALDFSPDGKTLAAGCADGQVMLWDAGSGRLVATLGRYALSVGVIRFSPDGRRLVSASRSQNPDTAAAEARVCDLATREEKTVPLGISRWTAVAFAPSGRPFAATIRAETVTLMDLG